MTDNTTTRRAINGEALHEKVVAIRDAADRAIESMTKENGESVLAAYRAADTRADLADAIAQLMQDLELELTRVGEGRKPDVVSKISASIGRFAWIEQNLAVREAEAKAIA